MRAPLLARLGGDSALRTAAAASNALNNLPAYLAIEPAVPAGHIAVLLGARLGTKTGPLILLWGSLATLLWRDRCAARGLYIHLARFAMIRLGGVPILLLTAWGALLVAG